MVRIRIELGPPAPPAGTLPKSYLDSLLLLIRNLYSFFVFLQGRTREIFSYRRLWSRSLPSTRTSYRETS
jgi:hypothetical protein